MLKIFLIPILILICTVWYRFSKKLMIPLLLIVVLGVVGVLTGTYMNIGFVAEHKLLLLLLLVISFLCIIFVRIVDTVIIPIAILIVLQAFGIISGISALPKLPDSSDIAEITEQIQTDSTDFGTELQSMMESYLS